MRELADKLTSGIQRLRFRAVVRRKVAIIACNCWGAEIYRELQEPYLTPFIGLFVYPESFLPLCEEIDRFLDQDPCFDLEPIRPRLGHSNYPVGTFPGSEVQIHFLHYASQDEARQKWRRRADRAKNPTTPKLFMFCDRDGASEDHLARFDALPTPEKVCFAAKNQLEYQSVHLVDACRHLHEVVDGKALYPHTRREFDLASWLNGKGLRRNASL